MTAPLRNAPCPIVSIAMAGLCVAACTGAADNDTDVTGPEGTTASSSDAESDGTETAEPSTGQPTASTDGEPPTGTDGDASTGTASSTGGETDGDTDEEPFCSNGVIDPGEECDEGLENSNNGACTLTCETAVCGDGLLWAGHETCDDGNTDNNDACVEGCVAASCGDGYLFLGAEECEPGEIDDNGEYACSLACMWSPIVAPPRLVFLSSVAFFGDLSIQESSLGDYSLSDFPDGGKTGVLLADARCQALAALGGLSNEGDAAAFHAWLSDNNGTDISSAIDRLQPNASPELQAGYTLPGGPMIATSFDALAQGLMSAIIEDEHGKLAVGAPYVWSNTSTSGEAVGNVDGMGYPTTCESWHSASNDRFGERGLATQEQPAWTQLADVQRCSKAYRLYCFQGG